MKNAKLLIQKKLIEITIDFFLITLGFCTAYWVRIGQVNSTDFPFFPYLNLVLFITPLIILFFAWSGLYSLEQKKHGEILRIIISGALAGSMLFVLFFFFKREFFFSRAIVFLSWGFISLFLFSAHSYFIFREKNDHQKGKNILRTLLIGNGRTAEKIIANFQKQGIRFKTVAIISPYGGGKKEIAGVPVLGKMNALEKITEEQRIDAIIQTDAPEHITNLTLFCEGNFLSFLAPPSTFGCYSDRFTAKEIGGINFITLEISPLFGWGQFWKRIFDITISGIFIVFLSPFFLLHTIKKQKCATGPKENLFEKYSFDTTGYIQYIPELINVFKGEMSLVGPRPRSQKEREHLKLHEQKRLVVKPGIFGPYQAKELEKNNSLPSSQKEKNISQTIQNDINYIFHWSFMKDIQILWKSFWKIVTK